MTDNPPKKAPAGAEPVQISVLIFLCAAAAALVVWQVLHLPDIARYVFFGGLAVHAVVALAGFREILHELNLKPPASELRKFGLFFLVGMGILGAVFWQVYDNGNLDRARYFFAAGGAVMVLSLIPPIGRLLYIVWMGLGLVMGLVTTPVIMFILFLVLIVPAGLIFKLKNRDLMKRTLDPKADSYWEEYPKPDDPSRYYKQF